MTEVRTGTKSERRRGNLKVFIFKRVTRMYVYYNGSIVVYSVGFPRVKTVKLGLL